MRNAAADNTHWKRVYNTDMFQPFDMAVDMEVYIGGACNNHPDVWTADQ